MILSGFSASKFFSKLSGSFRKHQLLSESMHAARFYVFILAVAVAVVVVVVESKAGSCLRGHGFDSTFHPSFSEYVNQLTICKLT